MKILKNKEFIIRIIILVISILFCFVYISLYKNDYFKNYIISKIKNEYDYNSIDFKEIMYDNSLNRIVNYNDAKNYKVMKIIDENEEVKEEINPIVYIYNTHDSETYYLPNVYDYSITPSVRLASLILKDYLNDFNVESFVQTKSPSEYVKKHNLKYSYTYEESRKYLLEELKNHEYKILIDLHRDSVKHKYTLFESNNKKYAKIMFVLSTKHKNYKENEKFANYLNDKLNTYYKGISRGILKRKDVIFNQDLSNNAILIELGGVDNTLEEINNSLYVLARVISEYITEENL